MFSKVSLILFFLIIILFYKMIPYNIMEDSREAHYQKATSNIDYQIIDRINLEGIEVVYTPTTPEEKLLVKSIPAETAKTIEQLSTGDHFKIFAFSNHYYKIQVRATTGFVQLSATASTPSIQTYPLLLLPMMDDPTYYQNSTTRNHLGNYPKAAPYINTCTSVRCSATTKKGTRCKKWTKSCNGRCYVHR